LVTAAALRVAAIRAASRWPLARGWERGRTDVGDRELECSLAGGGWVALHDGRLGGEDRLERVGGDCSGDSEADAPAGEVPSDHWNWRARKSARPAMNDRCVDPPALERAQGGAGRGGDREQAA
jgi:hypothetical protein